MTVASATASAPGRLRITPAPLTDPQPLGSSHAPVRPWRVVPAPRFEQPALPLHLAAGPLDADVDEVQLDLRRRTTTCGDMPAVEPLARVLARATVEVLAGARPVPQLLRWLTADVYGALQRRTALVERLRTQGCDQRSPAAAPRVWVRTVVVCTPRAGVAEAAVVVQEGDRVRAVGLRLETHRQRWRVTALEIG